MDCWKKETYEIEYMRAWGRSTETCEREIFQGTFTEAVAFLKSGEDMDPLIGQPHRHLRLSKIGLFRFPTPIVKAKEHVLFDDRDVKQEDLAEILKHYSCEPTQFGTP